LHIPVPDIGKHPARYPELNLLLLRRTLPELRENHIIPLQRELYGIAPYNSTERVFRFPNGSRIKLGYCDTAQDVYQYQGQEYAIIRSAGSTNLRRMAQLLPPPRAPP